MANMRKSLKEEQTIESENSWEQDAVEVKDVHIEIQEENITSD